MVKSKKLMLFGFIFAFAIFLYGGYQIYLSRNPDIHVNVSNVKNSNGCYVPFANTVILGRGFIPEPKSLNTEIDNYTRWSGQISDKLYRLAINPTDVKLTITTENGKTKLCYDGIFTDETGEQLDFHEENVFDFRVILD